MSDKTNHRRKNQPPVDKKLGKRHGNRASAKNKSQFKRLSSRQLRRAAKNAMASGNTTKQMYGGPCNPAPLDRKVAPLE